MGLRSTALMTVLACSSAALLAGTLWLWPALARRGAAVVALRLLLVGALQASTLALVFVQVNRSQEFYASWSDLLGTNSSTARIVAAPARTGSAVRRRAGAPGGNPVQIAAASRPGAPRVQVLAARRVAATGGRRPSAGWLRTVRFSGPLSGITVKGEVYVPAGAAGPLPVIVVIGAARAGTYSASAIAATAASQTAAGRLPRALVAVLPASVAGPGSQGCLDVPGGPQAATFFTQDLPAALRRAYHVATSQSGWAVVAGAGGGYCALQLATSPANVFGLVVVPPGGYAAPPGGFGRGSGKAVIGASPFLRSQDSPLWRLRHQPRPAIRLLIAGLGHAGQLLALARAPTQASTVGLAAGPAPLAPAFDWLGRAFRDRP